MAGDEATAACAEKHSSAPVVPFKAYILASYEPTYTVPSAPIAGEENTLLPVAKDHLSTPVEPCRAYTW